VSASVRIVKKKSLYQRPCDSNVTNMGTSCHKQDVMNESVSLPVFSAKTSTSQMKDQHS